ncbi:hypothetical protein Tsubulata_031317 [Turnera subulata]|uniref:RING-type E3 ubiquitin transferase n=1 Tax=Turnera subulata TaxID=218843 RepID=A0A9Q0JRP5_9ROSI|nr:hypothetical protein Tsubulata_031317 [Turnera subulata]
MEQNGLLISTPTRKRKCQEQYEDTLSFSLDELNQDLLERVLSWLPTSTFFRLTSVSKRWKSVADSASFKLACSEIPSRDPWFFMVDPHLNQATIFDSGERSWRKLNYPPLLLQSFNCDSMPVAASGGLVCFGNESGNFVVCNPVTGTSRELLPLHQEAKHQSLHAIAMSTCSKTQHSYKLVVVSGELPKLSFKVYTSSTGCWEEDILLKRTADESHEFDPNEDDAVYFLSKAGNVVASDMQRSPSKQYSSVMTLKDGEEIVYFLSSSGTIMACNLTRKCFSEYPRLLPVFCEYSIDVVECNGEMLVVVLSEFFESASLRVWRFDEGNRSWRQIAAMPPAMSHEFYGKKVDINCVGSGNHIFICLNSAELFNYVLCDLNTNEWVELPNRFSNGEADALRLQLEELQKQLGKKQKFEDAVDHLKNCIALAKEHLDQVENPPESSPSNRGYLFEGHLTVDPEPPRPQWLVQSNLMSSMAAVMEAGGSSGNPVEMGTNAESAATMLEELISSLDNIIPEMLDDGSGLPKVPPASKEVVANLPVITLTEEILAKLGQDAECSICKESLLVNDKMQELPCKHTFHPPCLKPWLDEHNSCPICRHELRTDDHAYESWKEREKEAEEERKGAANAVRDDFMYI